MANLITLTLAAVLLIWIYSMSDAYVALCPVSNCHALKKRFLVPLLLAGFCAGAFFSNNSVSEDLRLEASWLEMLFILAAVGTALTVGRAVSRFRPAVLALVGAFAGFDLLETGDVSGVSGIPVTWFFSFAASVLFGWLFCLIFRSMISRSQKHYLLQMWNIGIIITFLTVAMTFALGFNSGGFLGLPVRWSLLLFAIGPMAAVPVMVKRIFRLNERYFSINPDSTMAIVCAVTVTILTFSFQSICSRIGGSATLLSPGLLTFGAFIGCGLAKRQESLNGDAFLRLAGNALIVPVTAFSASYLLNLAINMQLASQRRMITAAILMIMGVTTVIVMAVLALRLYKSVRFSGKTMDEQAELLNENRRAINSMEIRTMQVENEYLRNQLELKRKELISIAVNITEQKDFIQKLSEKATAAAKQNNPTLKDEAIREICSELNLRLNFDNEIDSFYTRVEQLHKDFTIRLSEGFPNLTKQERRLTTLLRLGFSSKYIASLMNITPKSVEICRHRLRTKLGLTRDQNLSAFIKSI